MKGMQSVSENGDEEGEWELEDGKQGVQVSG